jgi:hypothetical protein
VLSYVFGPALLSTTTLKGGAMTVTSVWSDGEGLQAAVAPPAEKTMTVARVAGRATTVMRRVQRLQLFMCSSWSTAWVWIGLWLMA